MASGRTSRITSIIQKDIESADFDVDVDRQEETQTMQPLIPVSRNKQNTESKMLE